MSGYETVLLLIAWAVAGGSPGPATLAISGTAMDEGRVAGLSIAAGIFCGSAFWGIAAGAGMSAVMLANAWVFEVIRYAGAAYLMWLAFKAFKRALHPPAAARMRAASGLRRLWLKGALIHVTNPKAILSWGAIYAIALPPGATPAAVWWLFAMLIATSAVVFFGYGLLFSAPRIARGYTRLRRGFDAAFAVLFGAAGLKILTTRLEV
ncbi:LysE family translocator [Roseovarius pelagicus]|uniref:LysE family transporter n=1 Tax=Roseovarius pelagicus TaxID=2980108 RepID=A0ABY6DF72_9RHOB|nr:LysE family transporter [Roseovarius pelagicus]UXX84489.1 LysE family transporter [Roseovarius pelagicus]